MSLTRIQRKFAIAKTRGLNNLEAAVAAGCSKKSAASQGCKLTKHPNVIAHIARLEKASAVRKKEKPVVKARGKKPVAKTRGKKPVAKTRGKKPAAAALAEAPAEKIVFENSVDYLKHVMNDDTEDTKLRIEAATKLHGFNIPQKPDDGKKGELARAAEVASRGRFRQGEPPTLHRVK